MKQIIGPLKIVDQSAMTGTATITSKPVDIKAQDNIAVQAIWTGTPNGTLHVQASLDYRQAADGTVLNAGTWTDVIDAASLLPFSIAGAAGNELIDLNQLASPYLRVQYVNTSSTGTLDVWLFGKAVS